MEKIDKARFLIKENKLQEAFEIYRDIFENENDDLTIFQATTDMGFIYYENQQYEESIHFLNSALLFSFPDDNGRIHRILGFAFKELQKHEEAIEFLKEACELIFVKNDEYYFCAFELAKCEFRLQKYKVANQRFKECEDYFKHANKVDYLLSVLYHRSLLFINTREFDLALHCLNEMKQLCPSDNREFLAYAYFGKAIVAYHLNSAEEVLENSQKAIEIDSDFIEKETIVYFTAMAYRMKKLKNEYFLVIEHLIDKFPKGRYQQEYEALKNYQFEG